MGYLKSQNYAPHQKQVLLLDGHGSHVYNIEFLQMMTANNVHVFCFPPHTSHLLQPADVSIFKSLKSNWTTEGLKFTRDTGGKKVGRQHFFNVFTPAWERSISTENIQSGFRKTGIFPFNHQAIPKSAFLPSLTTERQTEEPVPPVLTTTVKDVTLAPVIITSQQKATVSHACTQTLDDTHLTEHLGALQSSAAEEEPIHNCSSNTSLYSADVSIDVGNGSLASLMDISMSELLNCGPEVTPDLSKSSDGVIPVQPSETTPPQNEFQPEIIQNFSDVEANTASHEVTEQSSDYDTVHVESELSKGDAGLSSGSTASTSNGGGDRFVAISQNTPPGIRIPFSTLCSPPQRVKSERKRKKPPSYCLTSPEHLEYITPQKKTTTQKTRKSHGKDKKKVQQTNQQPSEKKPVNNGKAQRKSSRGKTNKENPKRSESQDHTPCHYCGKQYDTPDDDKRDEEWLPCAGCTIWAHESCAETNGIIGDTGNDFLCRSCCD